MINDWVPMTDSEDSDGALLARVREGDFAATQALVARHRSWAITLARRCGAREQAEDIAHDALFALVRRPPLELRCESIRPLLGTDLRHRVGRAKQKAGRMPAFHPGSSLVEPAEKVRSVSSQVRLREVREHLHEAIELLKTPERQLVEWRYFEELKYGEIAERTGKSEAAARSGVFRAMGSLRRVLARRRLW